MRDAGLRRVVPGVFDPLLKLTWGTKMRRGTEKWIRRNSRTPKHACLQGSKTQM